MDWCTIEKIDETDSRMVAGSAKAPGMNCGTGHFSFRYWDGPAGKLSGWLEFPQRVEVYFEGSVADLKKLCLRSPSGLAVLHDGRFKSYVS